jgi:hypothetical protein
MCPAAAGTADNRDGHYLPEGETLTPMFFRRPAENSPRSRPGLRLHQGGETVPQTSEKAAGTRGKGAVSRCRFDSAAASTRRVRALLMR